MLRAFLDWLRSLFFSKQLDVACIGLQNAGKSSLVTVLTDNHFTEEMIPTVSVARPCRGRRGGRITDSIGADRGFNLRKIQKGNVVRGSSLAYRQGALRACEAALLHWTLITRCTLIRRR